MQEDLDQFGGALRAMTRSEAKNCRRLSQGGEVLPDLSVATSGDRFMDMRRGFGEAEAARKKTQRNRKKKQRKKKVEPAAAAATAEDAGWSLSAATSSSSGILQWHPPPASSTEASPGVADLSREGCQRQRAGVLRRRAVKLEEDLDQLTIDAVQRVEEELVQRGASTVDSAAVDSAIASAYSAYSENCEQQAICSNDELRRLQEKYGSWNGDEGDAAQTPARGGSLQDEYGRQLSSLQEDLVQRGMATTVLPTLRMMVTIPADTAVGSQITVEAPDERRAAIMLPNDVHPGDQIQVEIPAGDEYERQLKGYQEDLVQRGMMSCSDAEDYGRVLTQSLNAIPDVGAEASVPMQVRAGQEGSRRIVKQEVQEAARKKASERDEVARKKSEKNRKKKERRRAAKLEVSAFAYMLDASNSRADSIPVLAENRDECVEVELAQQPIACALEPEPAAEPDQEPAPAPAQRDVVAEMLQLLGLTELATCREHEMDATALVLCNAADLEEIGLPRHVAEALVTHFAAGRGSVARPAPELELEPARAPQPQWPAAASMSSASLRDRAATAEPQPQWQFAAKKQRPTAHRSPPRSKAAFRAAQVKQRGMDEIRADEWPQLAIGRDAADSKRVAAEKKAIQHAAAEKVAVADWVAAANAAEAKAAAERAAAERAAAEDATRRLVESALERFFTTPEPELPTGPMAEFDQVAVQAWLAAVPGLTAVQRSSLVEIMAEDKYNGADLTSFTERTLPRVLKGGGAEGAAPLLLAARDAQLAAEAEPAAEAAPAAPAPAERPSCSICMEPYSAAGGVVPRMLACGHDFCEGCLDMMLRPLPASKSRKVLPCPSCRKECAVKGGRAAELPIVYAVHGP
jgi:hypothetical protein